MQQHANMRSHLNSGNDVRRPTEAPENVVRSGEVSLTTRTFNNQVKSDVSAEDTQTRLVLNMTSEEGVDPESLSPGTLHGPRVAPPQKVHSSVSLS